MPKYNHNVLGAFTAFLRAFSVSMGIYTCFALSGPYGVYTRFLGAFHAVAVCFRQPVSLYARGAFPGAVYGAGAFCAAGIMDARRGFSRGAGAVSIYARGPVFRRGFSVFLAAFPAVLAVAGAVCFRGRRRFSIVFPGLFMIPGAAGRINIFSAAGAGKSQKNANEQIFTFRAAHAYAPAYARPRPCTRATPRTPDFPLRREEGKTGQIYSIRTRT